MKRLPTNLKKGLFVYVEEAHASDEWPIGLNGKISQCSNVRSIPQHKTDQERIDSAMDLDKRFPWLREQFVVTCAPISTNISKIFDAWPFGIWFMKGDRVVLKIKPSNDTTFHIDSFVDQIIELLI